MWEHFFTHNDIVSTFPSGFKLYMDVMFSLRDGFLMIIVALAGRGQGNNKNPLELLCSVCKFSENLKINIYFT